MWRFKVARYNFGEISGGVSTVEGLGRGGSYACGAVFRGGHCFWFLWKPVLRTGFRYF